MERSIRQYETDRVEAVRTAARLILASGTTTPRVGGVGECTIHIFDDPCDIEDICQKMEEMAKIKPSWNFFNRDAAMLRDADALLITTSLRCLNDPADINCNLCGKLVCEYLKEEEKLDHGEDVAFTGPLCTFRATNIAYALDGMMNQARLLGIDHGSYWSAGVAAMRMGNLPEGTGFAQGMAISITEKSPFRDIPKNYADINQRSMNDRMINRLWPQFRSIYS